MNASFIYFPCTVFVFFFEFSVLVLFVGRVGRFHVLVSKFKTCLDYSLNTENRKAILISCSIRTSHCNVYFARCSKTQVLLLVWIAEESGRMSRNSNAFPTCFTESPNDDLRRVFFLNRKSLEKLHSAHVITQVGSLLYLIAGFLKLHRW